MSALPRIRVDLRESPAVRWRALESFVARARELTDSYVKDLGGTDLFGPMISLYANAHVPAEVRSEIAAVAKLIDRPLTDTLIANLYYDAFRALMGCTAFAVDTPEGVLHARNLDWWTERNILSKHTLVVDFVGAPGGPFSTVGWPGFVGAFSGVAPGRFAITMNAVISDETPSLSTSIALTIRDVFENAKTFDEAVDLLESRTIAADCLLLVTGVEEDERVVVERTSTRSATRRQVGGPLVVTNDYRILDVTAGEGNELQATACSRFDRALYLACGVSDARSAFDVLRDPKVQMEITVQQMVFCAKSGLLEVRLP